MTTDHLEMGRKALSQYSWQEARNHFEAALKKEEMPEAFEGLANASAWLYDPAAQINARERAYKLYQARGDKQSAGRMATLLAGESLQTHGAAISNGWLQRAHRLLDDFGPSPGTAALAAMEAHITLMTKNNPAATRKFAEEAIRLAKQFDLTDIENLARAFEGLALVTEGDVSSGMSRLDEAATAVLAGDVEDFDSKGTILCYLIEACTRAHDYERASQWCLRAEQEFVRWGVEKLFAFCRPNHALVLMCCGTLQDAERELLRARSDMESTLPLMASESIVRLAELRIRQGKFKEAHELFTKVEHEGLAQPGSAELAILEGKASAAVTILERHLRHLPSSDRLERVTALDVLLRAHIALDDLKKAKLVLDEIKNTASAVSTEPFKALYLYAEGRYLAANKKFEEARELLQDAIDLYQKNCALLQASLCRLTLAGVFDSLGMREEGAYHAMTALNTFKQMGSTYDAKLAEEMLRKLHDVASIRRGAVTSTADTKGLTGREIDVLRLLAAGKSNQAIAASLFLSTRTVERHISTIYQKIGAGGKVARAAAAAYAIKQGIS